MAILAGGAVLGLGATATLAAWTDTEWVFGGNGADAGVGTSSFEVEQNVSAPFSDFLSDGTTTAWNQNETNPGNELTFGLSALSLTPGDSLYAPVALRTIAGAIAGDVTLQPAVAASGVSSTDPAQALWDALTVRVWASTTAQTCDATIVASGATLIVDGALASAGGQSAEVLMADRGNTQYYCFEVTLPRPTDPQEIIDIAGLQGRTVAPAWEFAAASN